MTARLRQRAQVIETDEKGISVAGNDFYAHLWACSDCYAPTKRYCKIGARKCLDYHRACGSKVDWKVIVDSVAGD